MTGAAHPDLAAAVALSRDVVEAADQGDMALLADLDARRLRLLQSFRSVVHRPFPADLALLREITALNERALGLMEHRRRIQGRAMDAVALGRRAVNAYASNRSAR